jgi:hypothetical protein
MKWICGATAAVLLTAAVILPPEAIVQALAGRFHTVKSSPSDFVRGLQLLRAALALNALLIGILPRALDRMAFKPSGSILLPREDRLPAAGLYLLALGLGALGVRESFQDDEWRCLEQYIQHGPLVIATRSAADNHVLYSLLAWPFVAVLGMTEVALRLPALLLSPLAPALLYILLRREHPRVPAFLASLPLAASSFLLSYSHDGRAYGVLFPSLLGLFLLQPAAFGGSAKAWGSYVALGVATAYLHIYASMAVIGLSATGALLPQVQSGSWRVRNGMALALTGGISLLLYAPILPQYLDYAGSVQGEVSHGRLVDTLGQAFVLPLSWVWAVPFVGASLAGLVTARRLTPAGSAFLVTGGLLWVLTEVARSEHAARLYVPALVFGWICLAQTLAKAPSPWRVPIVLALLAITAVSDFQYFRIGRRDYREAARKIDRLKGPGETFATIFDCRPMTAYAREPFPILTPASLIARPPDWLTVIDGNLGSLPELAAFVDHGYEEIFRIPSVRGDLLGLRKRNR